MYFCWLFVLPLQMWVFGTCLGISWLNNHLLCKQIKLKSIHIVVFSYFKSRSHCLILRSSSPVTWILNRRSLDSLVLAVNRDCLHVYHWKEQCLVSSGPRMFFPLLKCLCWCGGVVFFSFNSIVLVYLIHSQCTCLRCIIWCILTLCYICDTVPIVKKRNIPISPQKFPRALL